MHIEKTSINLKVFKSCSTDYIRCNVYAYLLYFAHMHIYYAYLYAASYNCKGISSASAICRL